MSLLTRDLSPYFAKPLEGLVNMFRSGGGAGGGMAQFKVVAPPPPHKPALSGAAIAAIRVWAVFLACLIFSLAGVWLSFRVFGDRISAVGHWEAALAIAIIMLGLTYGAKYASPAARRNINPVDLIQYISQGFLWPSTWPALAERLHLTVLPPPKGATSHLIQLGTHLLRLLHR